MSGERDFICGVVEGFYGRPWSPAQRKDLFMKMKSFGLNTYIYAPKDDFKHRAYWRELYSVEEGDQLAALISNCKENGITFYYALSPGLDIVYSNSKEINCLKRKLEQVVQFGCDAFALFFDDIEPEISETDKEVFQSYGHAQVSVTNEVYQSLRQPKFLFCPTEYCTSRAVPNVHTSEYLNTLGTKLLPNIDILWTGNKVISKTISVQSIQELSEVLKRNPVLWDNIHANDYDQKRVFLGPYSGRSTQLTSHLRGVLTNPNCEYEPNFVAIHTLAQWSRCSSDANCDLSSSDIKLEIESDSGSLDNIPTRLSATTYHPRRALKAALEAWLPEFNRNKEALAKPTDAITAPLAAVLPVTLTLPPQLPLNDNNTIDGEQPVSMDSEKCHVTKKSTESMNDSGFQPITKELVNSLVTPPIILNPLEPMDCNASPALSPKHSSDSQMMEDQPSSIMKNENSLSEPLITGTSSEPIDQPVIEVNKNETPSIELEEMQTECFSHNFSHDSEVGNSKLTPSSSSQNISVEDNEPITLEDISLLVDLFYLPFEYGSLGCSFLVEFHWLRTNGYLISEERRRITDQKNSPEVLEWFERAKKFHEMTATIERLTSRLVKCKNLSLIYDLYPYMWDLRGAVSLLDSFIEWMSLGKIPSSPPAQTFPTFTWFSKGYKEAFSSGDQEPWIFRGGLTGELQRLLPVEGISDLFVYKPPDSPSSQSFTVRPYFAPDEVMTYKIYNKGILNSYGSHENFKLYPELLADKFIGGFLTLSPEYCFIVEDSSRIVGYAVAALDSRKFGDKLRAAWIPEMCSKYPLPKEKKDPGEVLNSAEEMITSMHQDQTDLFRVPDAMYKAYPSLIYMDILPLVTDTSVPKRLLSLVLAALKVNGSNGVTTRFSTRDENVIDFYLKLGFQEISIPKEESLESNDLFLGRNL
ncbi:O-GlcNAcase [Brevipalpus obovatus]|uniref:O-GlcNAcase n=1 Tax=Brevipalpus obovatus TaxID=246614 RepID=UPI003D9F31B8